MRRLIGRFLWASIALSGFLTCLLIFMPHDAGQTRPPPPPPPPPPSSLTPTQAPQSPPPTMTTSPPEAATEAASIATSRTTHIAVTQLTAKKKKLQQRPQPNSKSSQQPSYRKRCWKSGGYSPASGGTTNHTPGDFLINESRLCSGHLKLLVIVHSAIGARRRRDLSRSTWASLNSVSGHRLAVVFVVGTNGDARQQAALRSESAEAADLVQAPCQPDGDPRTSTCKALYSLLWVSRHCTGAEFLLKVDDHVFVNVFHLAALVTGRLAGAVNTFYCRTAAKEGRIVLQQYAWYVSQEEWPAAVYPLHCKGLAYLMSADLAPRLLQCAAWRNHLHLEDVFVTGVLGQALGARMLHWPAGWGADWLHPRHAGEAVTGAIVLSSQAGVPLPSLHRRVWKAALVYSADFV